MCDAIYIHIPFCVKKCGYCDFLSFSCEEKSKADRSEYVEKLIEEIRLYPSLKYDTVYFGGGTPSLLEVEEIEKILGELSINRGAEITLEVNPQTVDMQKLEGFKKIGINRLSIGIQSFNDEKLKVLGRIHSKEIALKTYNEARKVGFENLSIDLIFATPNQTIEELEEDLDIVERISPEHISIYSLIWEEGTKFMDLLDSGKLNPLDNSLEAKMYELIIDRLKKIGYLHYEISNFAKKGYEGRHNSKYWKNVEYIGAGLGASGYYKGIRYKNEIELSDYYKKIDNTEKPLMEEEEVSEKDRIENYYILGLRLLNEGIEAEDNLYFEKIKGLCRKGYLKNEEGRYKLTPKGLMFANDVFVEIME
ncbi:radical SAM family heme chaperone HemW [Psychrilyobacter atlanticus]|uniref:radical SAM family heme chaperone HemW n=1 Tax=Psychrilyobacter atlanticus TaxID=271091 RepID=UPI00041BB11B|nr:radical SAM family heme chaperone HemW [Psychrilyobacter atlanticus]